MRRYRSISIAVFAVVFCALVGGFYGRSALAIEDTKAARTLLRHIIAVEPAHAGALAALDQLDRPA